MKYPKLSLFLTLAFSWWIHGEIVQAQSTLASPADRYVQQNNEIEYLTEAPLKPQETIDNSSFLIPTLPSHFKITLVEQRIKDIQVEVKSSQTNGFLSILFGNGEIPFDILLLDSEGELLFSNRLSQTSQYELDLSQLAQASYYLNIVSTSDMKMRNAYKIVKSESK